MGPKRMFSRVTASAIASESSHEVEDVFADVNTNRSDSSHIHALILL
jgi:hypothetical protein